MESEQRLSRPLIPSRDTGRLGAQGTTSPLGRHGAMGARSWPWPGHRLVSPSVKCRSLPFRESCGDDCRKVLMRADHRGKQLVPYFSLPRQLVLLIAKRAQVHVSGQVAVLAYAVVSCCRNSKEHLPWEVPGTFFTFWLCLRVLELSRKRWVLAFFLPNSKFHALGNTDEHWKMRQL